MASSGYTQDVKLRGPFPSPKLKIFGYFNENFLQSLQHETVLSDRPLGFYNGPNSFCFQIIQECSIIFFEVLGYSEA